MIEPGAYASPDIQTTTFLVAEIDVIHLLTQILRRKGLILRTTAFCLALGLIAAFLLPVKYSADTELLPPQQRQSSAAALMSQIGGAGGSLMAGLGGSFETKTSADLYARMLTARPVLEAVIRRFNLLTVYKRSSLTDAAKTLTANTTITTAKEGFIIIEVTDRDATRAAAIANGYADALRGLMQSLALTESSQRRAFYDQQLSQTKDSLAQAEVAFKQMQQSNRMISLGDQAKALIEGAAGFRAQIAAKEVQLQSLRSFSTESNPQVQIAEKELAALRSELGKSEARNESGYTGIGLSSVPGAELGFVRANRELRYQEELYSLLLREYEAARIDEARDAPMLQVIEPAVPAQHRSSPRRGLILVVCAVTGLILGLAFALVGIWQASLAPEERLRLAELRQGWR